MCLQRGAAPFLQGIIMDVTFVAKVDFFDFLSYFGIEVEDDFGFEDEFADEEYEYDDDGVAYWFDEENEVWYWYDEESDDWYECEDEADEEEAV
jgi:hypothetical protein